MISKSDEWKFTRAPSGNCMTLGERPCLTNSFSWNRVVVEVVDSFELLIKRSVTEKIQHFWAENFKEICAEMWNASQMNVGFYRMYHNVFIHNCPLHFERFLMFCIHSSWPSNTRPDALDTQQSNQRCEHW